MAGALVTISAETESFLFVPLLATHLDVERAERGGVGPVRAGKSATALLSQLRLHVGDRPRQLTHDVVAEDLEVPRHRDLRAEGRRGPQRERRQYAGDAAARPAHSRSLPAVP